MKNKIICICLLTIIVFSACSCSLKKNEVVSDASVFKEEYEKLNGTRNLADKENRSVTIDADNPIVYSSIEEVVSKIKNKETFFVYFGDKLCPWCRSVIEKAIESANKKNIDTIYYVSIWDDEGNEVVRDKYSLDEKNKPVKNVDGSESYYELLELLGDELEDYVLKTDNGKEVSVGEKRIFAPNFIYIKDGKMEAIVDGISKLQKDSREELTEEMLKEETKIFNEFFDKR